MATTIDVTAHREKPLQRRSAASLAEARRLGLFWLLNTIGGVAVLGSYVLWLSSPAHDAQALWGALGEPVRTLYTVSMFTAAGGYLTVLAALTRGGFAQLSAESFASLLVVFALILFPSALWMPLAFEYLAAPSLLAWVGVRSVLFVVAAGSCALVTFLVQADEGVLGRRRRIAIYGALAFAFQTAVLDACVWPLWFPA